MLVPYNIDNIKNNVICRVICLPFPFCRNISNGIYFFATPCILSFYLKLFGKNRLIKSVKVLPLSIKPIDLIQKYPHITESYACILKNICCDLDPLMKVLISFGICSNPKLSK